MMTMMMMMLMMASQVFTIGLQAGRNLQGTVNAVNP
jgi:hypothetical protein